MLLRKGGTTMRKFQCQACEYIYQELLGDPDNGVDPKTLWENVPEDWFCPECGVPKDMFDLIEE